MIIIIIFITVLIFLKHTLPQNERLASLLSEGVLNLQKQKTVLLFI